MLLMVSGKTSNRLYIAHATSMGRGVPSYSGDCIPFGQMINRLEDYRWSTSTSGERNGPAEGISVRPPTVSRVTPCMLPSPVWQSFTTITSLCYPARSSRHGSRCTSEIALLAFGVKGRTRCGRWDILLFRPTPLEHLLLCSIHHAKPKRGDCPYSA